MTIPFNIEVGRFVEATNVPAGVLSCPTEGLVGVVTAPAGFFGDGAGPLVTWQNGMVCNVYRGWVRLLEGRVPLNTEEEP